MTPAEVLRIFEDLYVDDRVAPVDDATAAIAGWMTEKLQRRSADALLATHQRSSDTLRIA